MTTNGNETPDQPEQPEELQPQPAEPQPRGGQASAGIFGIPTKWLAIGGGGGGGILLIVIIAVVLFVLLGGGNPQPTSILDVVPDDATSVVRIDLQRTLANDLLADDLDFDDMLDALEDELGINPDNLSEIAVADWNNGGVVVLKGNFDLDYIRDELDDADAADNPYRGYEVWETESGGAAALLEGYLVTSRSSVRSVESVLKNLYNGSGSLEQADDDHEMKLILDKLGSGYIVVAASGNSCQVERCEGYGWVATEVDEDDNEVTLEIALLFRNERSAESAAEDYDEVANFLERTESIEIEDTEAEGRFVVGIAIDSLEEEDTRSNRSSDQTQETPANTPSFVMAQPTAAAPERAVMATEQPAAVAATSTPRPAPTATPVPQLEPASVFSLIPENANNVLWVHWEKTLAGSYLPSRIEGQVFNTIDIFRKDLDISPETVSEMALFHDQSLTVLKGKFDLSSIRSALDRRNAEQVNYRGYELWRGSRGETFALFDEYIAYSRGPIEPVLQNLYRGAGSLADASENNDMRRVLSKLGDAVIVNAAVPGNCPFEHCLGYGWAITEIDESRGIGEMNIGFLFRNQRAAAGAADEYDGILNFLQRTYGINIQDTIPDGNFVVGNAIWEFE